MYLVADISVEICAAKSCKLCTQYCPEANTILYSEEMGKEQGFKYGSAYVAVDRCKGCAQCVWVCDNMAKNNAIKMIMIDQLPKAALTDNITYGEKSTTAVLGESCRRVRKGSQAWQSHKIPESESSSRVPQGFILRLRRS